MGKYIMTDEHKKRIGDSQRGKIISEECKIKISLAKKGRRVTEQHRQNIIKSLTGRIRTEESKKKISKSLMGHKISNITKDKISKTVIKNNGGIPKERGFWKIERDRFKCSSEGMLWRMSVFARDGFICQKCKIKGTELNAHHILNFNKFIELRTSINNGITYCKKCHINFHKLFGKINNSKEQVEGWVESV